MPLPRLRRAEGGRAVNAKKRCARCDDPKGTHIGDEPSGRMGLCSGYCIAESPQGACDCMAFVPASEAEP